MEQIMQKYTRMKQIIECVEHKKYTHGTNSKSQKKIIHIK